jgi:hypothetical protein
VDRAGGGSSTLGVLAAIGFANVFAHPDVLMTTHVRSLSMMRLAKALGTSDHILSVDQFVDYAKKRLGQP